MQDVEGTARVLLLRKCWIASRPRAWGMEVYREETSREIIWVLEEVKVKESKRLSTWLVSLMKLGVFWTIGESMESI